ncbi:MAG TPA: hypothetical protein VH592_23165 [Gemmataceae bacterium]
MSRSWSAPSPSDKIDLETVVNWPLLISTASAAILLLAVPLILACIAALRGHAVKEPVASLSAAPQPQPVTAAPTPSASVPLHSVVKQQMTEKAQPRQVYVKGGQTPIPPDPTPIPKRAQTPPPPPPERNPILQVREVKEPNFKRLDESGEAYLIALLYETIAEVDLESVEGTREKLLAETRESRKDVKQKQPAILALRAERPDLKGLPMREGAACQAHPEAVARMREISITLRRELDFPARRVSTDGDVIHPRTAQLQKAIRTRDKWFQADGLSTLAQMIEVEAPDARSEFIKRLDKVEGAKASVLLARQAVFDLSWIIRKEAIQALKDRPREEYRQVLLDTLRYPWAPVAAHAAEALVALNDRATVFSLADMLDQPDPCAPVRNKNDKWVVAEVVKINHLRNCLLCHAPSTDRKDPLRAIVPTPGQPLPRVYYDTGRGDFVRADVTYLRQDFSLIERVAKPEKWPEWQRFDYVVRKRELTADELATHEKKRLGEPAATSYPQREAVLFALRELTGQDAGENSTDWYDLLSAYGASSGH